MNTYVIKRTAAKPDWSTVPEIELGNRYIDTPKDARVFAKIAYSDEALHVYLRSVEPGEIRREESGPLGEPYHDSCLEFFFCPKEDDPRYFNFEFNSNKCLYLGFRNGYKNAARLIVDIDDRFAPEIRFVSDGWEIEYRIPYSFVRIFFPAFDPKPSEAIRANCFKCADMAEPGHFLSWSRVTEESFTFHKPECFGRMVFGE